MENPKIISAPDESKVVGALQCCLEWNKDCSHCPYAADPDCISRLVEAALDLIRFKNEANDAIRWTNKHLLKVEKKRRADVWKKAILQFAEAVKKEDCNVFIEERYEDGDLCYAFDQEAFSKYIDSLAKDMIPDSGGEDETV